MEPARIGWGIWTCWSLALVGGVAVLGAAVVALTDRCASHGLAAGSEACADGVPLTLVRVLTTGGTTLAIVGGLAATLLTVRRLRRRG